VATETREASLRLTDLRRAHAADATLENLLNAVTGKIQSCARLAVFEYEAGTEGHDGLALAFRELGEIERESFKTLLAHLRRHLNELPAEPPRATPYKRSSTTTSR
jgi:hypothetical protein